jgi:hypothetical protein
VTWRIRTYLAILAFRYIGTGLVVHRQADNFAASPHFRYVFTPVGASAWAAIFVAVGVVAIGGVIWPRALPIRFVLVTSVVVTLIWAASFAAAEIVDGTRAALATISFTAFAAKDLVVSSMPFVAPLPPWADKD